MGMDGVTYQFNQTWTRAGGETCLCVQGVAECGGAPGGTNSIYFDDAGLVGVVVSVLVMSVVLVGFAYFFYTQNKLREQIEGRRKSKEGQTYFTNTVVVQPGQQEIELPS